MLRRCCKRVAALCTGISTLVCIGTGKGIGIAKVYAAEAVAEQPVASEGMKNSLTKGILYTVIALFLVIAILLVFRIYRYIPQWLANGMVALRAILARIGLSKKANDSLDKAVKISGYIYDPKQDIYYSDMNPWQRKYGYCRLYDEAATPMGMIIDCEPIYFEYGEKKWLIEFWKGQYDLTTGCEIGVFTTEGTDLNIPGVFNGTFYNSASNEDRLQMSYSLRKNGKTLFTREDKSWWLTGFKLGEFSEPSQLTMNINIILKDETMCNAFVNGLRYAGYSDYEIIKRGNTISLEFNNPHVQQPVTRTKATDWIMQKKNKYLCDKYQEVAGKYNNMEDKVKALKQREPEMYDKVMNMGKNKQLYSVYDTIKDYLN